MGRRVWGFAAATALALVAVGAPSPAFAGGVAISTSDVSVSESAGSVGVVVLLSRKSSHTVKVDYTTIDGSAAQPGDYTTTAGTLTFKPGRKKKTIPVPVVN